MKTIIIEDEDFAARRLENMIRECDSTIEIVALETAPVVSVNKLDSGTRVASVSQVLIEVAVVKGARLPKNSHQAPPPVAPILCR